MRLAKFNPFNSLILGASLFGFLDCILISHFMERLFS